MKIHLVLSHTEPETVFNAIRLAQYSLKQGDTVEIFLMGKGVEPDVLIPCAVAGVRHALTS